MYIYQLTSDYIHSEAVPYKEFPMNKFIDDLHCLLTQQTHDELVQLEALEKQLRNKSKYEKKTNTHQLYREEWDHKPR